MSNKILMPLSFCLALIVCSCSKDVPVSSDLTQSAQSSNLSKAGGETQISGIGFYPGTGECEDATQGADFAIKMTGDFEGCLYVFVNDYACSPSGTYREDGTERFVGTYLGEPGTFETTYKFASKYEGCAPDGSFLGLEIFGRCHHPITPGSGTGVFAGATGRIDFKDNIPAGNFPYRGHLKF